MKNPFLKKLMTILEKEICQDDHIKEAIHHPLLQSTSIPKTSSHEKPLNVASKYLKSQETVLGEGVCVKGELHFDKQLKIHGSFEGSLKTSGKLIVGQKGFIKGDIELDEVEVYGKVVGNITAERLKVGSTAEIFGNIHVQSLDLEKGAKLVGQLQIEPTLPTKKIHVFEEAAVLENSG